MVVPRPEQRRWQSSDTSRRSCVAPAWPYAAGKRHLGHVVGFAVPADIFARYHRLKGNDVLMVSGTDEHGTPVMVTADREGVSPREIADRYNAAHPRGPARTSGSRTTASRARPRGTTARVTHGHLPHALRARLSHRADDARRVLRPTGTRCPTGTSRARARSAAIPEARGDQCDNCGNQLDPVDLINPRSIIDGTTPEFRETKHLFLDLPAVRRRGSRRGSTSKTSWRPNVRNFSLGLVDDLKPRAMTRDIDWGDPGAGRRGIRGHEADLRLVRRRDRLSLGERRVGARTAVTPDAWREWWQNPESRHCVLHGQGQHRLPHGDLAGDAARLRRGRRARRAARRPAPADERRRERVPDDGGQASRRRAAAIAIYVARLPRALRPGPAALLPHRGRPRRRRTRDFTWAEFVRRNNDELLANWGNLVNRTLDERAPQLRRGADTRRADRRATDSVLEAIAAGFDTVGALIEAGALPARAIAEAMRARRALGEPIRRPTRRRGR